MADPDSRLEREKKKIKTYLCIEFVIVVAIAKTASRPESILAAGALFIINAAQDHLGYDFQTITATATAGLGLLAGYSLMPILPNEQNQAEANTLHMSPTAQ